MAFTHSIDIEHRIAFVRGEGPFDIKAALDAPLELFANVCAAIHHGLTAIAAKKARFVLVVGVEKMTDLPGPELGRALLKASYLKEEGGIEGGFAGVFGQIAQQYFQRHGDQSDALAAIAANPGKDPSLTPRSP